MKKSLPMICLLVLICCLSGCGRPMEAMPFKPLAEAVADAAPEAAQWLRLPQEDLSDVLGIPPEDYTEFVYLQESSLSGREILVLRTPDREAAQRVRARAEAYLERRRKETRNYLPEAYRLLEAANVEVKNNTVALIAGERAADQVRKLMAGE